MLGAEEIRGLAGVCAKLSIRLFSAVETLGASNLIALQDIYGELYIPAILVVITLPASSVGLFGSEMVPRYFS